MTGAKSRIKKKNLNENVTRTETEDTWRTADFFSFKYNSLIIWWISNIVFKFKALLRMLLCRVRLSNLRWYYRGNLHALNSNIPFVKNKYFSKFKGWNSDLNSLCLLYTSWLEFFETFLSIPKILEINILSIWWSWQNNTKIWIIPKEIILHGWLNDIPTNILEIRLDGFSNLFPTDIP